MADFNYVLVLLLEKQLDILHVVLYCL